MLSRFAITLLVGVALSIPAFTGEPFSHLGILPWVGSVSLFVVPASLSLPSSTPNNTVIGSNSLSWIINLGVIQTSSWTLSVYGTASTCTTAPLSAIAVKCTAITDTGVGAVSHACASQINLSTTAQTLATGVDASLLITNGHRSVSIQTSYSDSFKYTATTNPCNLNLTYILTSM